MVVGYLSVHAQDNSDQKVNSKGVTNSSTEMVNALNTDPKLSSDQGYHGPAISNNPAKPSTPLFDPKLRTEETGSTIAKPPADQQKDPKLQAEAIYSSQEATIPNVKTESKVTDKPVKGSNDQPAGTATKNTVNYRNIKATDAQPASSHPAKTDNYRKMKGPDNQPAGEKPKR